MTLVFVVRLLLSHFVIDKTALWLVRDADGWLYPAAVLCTNEVFI